MKLSNRQSIRLQNYDYSASGYYFVTICTHRMNTWFGEIMDAQIHLSDVGQFARQCWLNIPQHYPSVELDQWIIMPNHIHGIIIIKNDQNFVGAQNFVPLQNKYQSIIPRSLGCIIRGFKIGVAKWSHANGHSHFRWQRNYYDHIIRNEKSLHQIRHYIIHNPAEWKIDEYHSN